MHHFTNVQTRRNVTQLFPCFWLHFPLASMDMYVSVFLFPFSSFRILPLNAQKTLYFFHPSLCADLAVHYMTQTLVPFTFRNSTFSSLPLSMLFFLLKVFSNVKRLYFLKKNFPFSVCRVLLNFMLLYQS